MDTAQISNSITQLTDTFIELRHSNSYRKFDKEFIAKEYNTVLVLSFLMNHGKAVVAHELAEALVRSSSQMAVLLNHMEEQGYIKRVDDKEDARQIVVRITSKGEKFCKQKLKCSKQLIENIFDAMGKEQSEQFVSSFRVFLQACSEVYSERSLSAENKRKKTGREG